jgi:uncharacterized RDD family membrane protein YckC
VIGISGGLALILLLVVGFIFLAMVGLAYLILQFLPSPSDNPQQFPSKQDVRSPSAQDEALTRHMPSKESRWPHAIVAGVIWYALWVIYTNVLPLLWRPNGALHRNIVAEAFGFATASIVGLVGVTWCVVWLRERFVRRNRNL